MEMDKPGKAERKGYLLHPGEGAAGFDASVKASTASTGGAITLIESHTRGGAPRHVHTREDECFYVIAGRIIVHCGEDTFEGGPGSFVFLPREVPHDWDVLDGGEATVLMITVPAMLETFLAEFHAASSREEVARKYGVTFL
jgi:mannose-6-phosphate isomerase-like protein (cupin superfamily)